jgi:hypothetical protein
MLRSKTNEAITTDGVEIAEVREINDPVGDRVMEFMAGMEGKLGIYGAINPPKYPNSW